MTYYVSPQGSDSNYGTSQATPWAHEPTSVNSTGFSAAAVLKSNDTIILLPIH